MSRVEMPTLSVVVPVFNEQECLAEFYRRAVDLGALVVQALDRSGGARLSRRAISTRCFCGKLYLL